MRIGVIGAGKLGLPMAALFASSGNEITLVDVNEKIIGEINAGRCPIKEPGLSEMLKNFKDNIKASTDLALAVRDTDITFIMVPTPSNEKGIFINDYIISAIKSIGGELSAKDAEDDWHIVVITSTVMPGSCQNVFAPLIEEITGKVVGKDIGLAYNPEFIALGSVLRDMSNPDAILIGESDKRSGDFLEWFYKDNICENNPPIKRMSWNNAELAKLALNVFVTTKISLANTFARICSSMPDGNVDDVTGFIGMDKRVGSKYLKGGLGFAGPCFPRDNRAFISLAEEYGAYCPIQEHVDTFNQSIPAEVALSVFDCAGQELQGESKIVAVLGLTYKSNTPVVDESQSIQIIEQLLDLGMDVRVHDPMGMESAKKQLGKSVRYCNSPEECATSADILLLAMDWDEYKELDWQYMRKIMRKPVILDCWRSIPREVFKGFEYHAIGVNG